MRRCAAAGLRAWAGRRAATGDAGPDGLDDLLSDLTAAAPSHFDLEEYVAAGRLKPKKHAPRPGQFSSSLSWDEPDQQAAAMIEKGGVREAPKHRRKDGPMPTYLGSQADLPFEKLIKEVNLFEGPHALHALLDCKDAPAPLDVYRAIVARHRSLRFRDHPLSVLLHACRVRIQKNGTNPRGRAIELNQARSLFFEAMSAKHEVGVLAHTAVVLCACAGDRADYAVTTIKKMKGMGMRIPPNVYVALISAKCNERGADLKAAWAVFEEMIESVEFGAEDKTAIHTSLGYAATALINGAVKKESVDDAEKAWKLVVEKWKVPANVYLYTAYIRALAIAKRATTALDMYSEMKMNGVTPSVQTYGALLQCFGDDMEDIEQAEALFQEMLDAKVQPNIVVFTLLLQIYQKLGDAVGMRGVYRRLRRAGLHPTSHTWNVLLTACIRHTKTPADPYAFLILGIWQKARDGLLTKVNAPPPPKSPPTAMHPFFVPLLRVLTAHQERDAVVDVVRYLKDNNVLFTLKMFDIATNALRDVGADGELEAVMRESEEKKQMRQQRLKNSTLPRHAASRTSLLRDGGASAA